MRRAPVIRLLYDDMACIDGFAGGGGTSTGIEMFLGRSPDVAINHDAEALAMHRVNHPATQHIQTNIRKVNWRTVAGGRRVGFGWFSPDCTFHSKARGGKPFRDRNMARRVRGLAWEVVRCAVEARPLVLFVENVEEFQWWGPLGKDGKPNPKKRGQSFARWVARLRNLGYAVEWRESRASDFGAPTSRKRLFVIARCDGQPIVWPMPTHGKRLKPYRTAADCIDFSLPVPSIFLTPAEAKEWALAHGVPAPKRPLAEATLRRVARGIHRFVIDSPDPFIVDMKAPFITEHANASGQRNFRADEPLRTICAGVKGGHFALVAPTLIQVGYGEREGQAPRILNLHAPLGTVVGGGMKHALVAAFLAKHNGGHEATGQRLLEPAHAITTIDQKALVTSHLLKLYGTCQDGAAVDVPMPVVTASGNHLAEVRAFLVKYYGNEKDGRSLRLPMDTIVTKERFALVTVVIDGETYVIADIGMRMLTPRELFRAQGFPDSYAIDVGLSAQGQPVKFTKKTQTRLCGNSVSPYHAAALIGANLTWCDEATA